MRNFSPYIILFGLSVKVLVAQTPLLHQDQEIFKSIREGLDHTYNFEFEKAQPHFLEIKKKYPHHPAYPFSQALVLFIKNFPMKPTHPDYKQFDYFVQDCFKKSEAILEKQPQNADGIFFALSANSYSVMMQAFSKDYLGAISSAKKVYTYIKKGFEQTKNYPDFYYTSGLFYYYAAQYPETHPIIKPFMFFFEDGNKSEGLLDLNIAMLKGIYTKQEAYILLAYVYLKYENKPAKSLEYSEKFYYNYPNNPFALSKYIEGLLFNGDYPKAAELLPKLLSTNVEYFRMTAEVYAGILDEKYHQKWESAKGHYVKSLQLCTQLKNKTEDQQSFCYLGLGRIYEAKNDQKKALLYYRKALDLAEYEAIKKESRARLTSETRLFYQH